MSEFILARAFGQPPLLRDTRSIQHDKMHKLDWNRDLVFCIIFIILGNAPADYPWLAVWGGSIKVKCVGKLDFFLFQ